MTRPKCVGPLVARPRKLLTVTASLFHSPCSGWVQSTAIRSVLNKALPVSCIALLLSFVLSGCGGTETEPSPPPPVAPPASPAASPAITAISPSSPTQNSASQTIAISGSNFETGLTVVVTVPGGATTTLSGQQIQNVTAASFQAIVTLASVGAHSLRVTNPSGQSSNTFNFDVQSAVIQTTVPSSVLSPVVGALRVTSTNLHIPDGLWEFDQHKTGLHGPGGGISGSDDTYAWDVNLYTATNSNADAGMPVRAAAEGDVVDYAGVGPGRSLGAVLIAHPNRQSPVWWSGYLHMAGIAVVVGQHVTTATVIGNVGHEGVDNDHLHFVVYTGADIQGGLRSFNTSIQERAGSVVYTVSGTVTDMISGAGVSGANVRIVGGANNGKSATSDGSGRYSISGVVPEGISVSISAAGYLSNNRTATVTGDTRLDFALTPAINIQVAGGTYNDRDFGLFRTSFLYNPATQAGTATFIDITGPPGWNNGQTFRCGLEQPVGIASNRSICWAPTAPPISGQYSAVTTVAGQQIATSFSVNSANSITPPQITNVSASQQQVTVTWDATAQFGSFLVRVNPVPFTMISGQIIVSGTARTATIGNLSLIANASYQVVVFGFSDDVRAGSFPSVFNMGAQARTFPISSPPIARDDSYSMTHGTTLTVPAPGVLANDTIPANSNPQVQFYGSSVGTNPPPAGLGVFSNVGSGGFAWDLTRNPTATGTFVFYYVVHTTFGDSNAAKVTVNVN